MRILRGVGSTLLPCGCLVGLYETYDGRTVGLLDARNPACVIAAHHVNALVSAGPSDSTSVNLQQPTSETK